MNKRYFIFILLFLNFNLFAQEKANETVLILHQDLKQYLTLGLNYLEKTQRKETIPGHSYRGEWQTLMCLRMNFFYLGAKKEVDDSNCFSVVSIHNSLCRSCSNTLR